ncbi:hypothetical protein C8R45DRAFT_1113600 [Mycena sanguinolenta]|nr:hypothetical protein C8R45DRAFT_1113600 [Mycena sanguinolenta]
MNDTAGDLYIKYGPNHVGLDVAAIVVGVLGVIGIALSGGILAVFISAPLIAGAIGLGTVGGAITVAGLGLSLTGAFLAGVDVSAKDSGYHKVGPGGAYRSERLTLSLVHQADVKIYVPVDNQTVTAWSGAFTVFSGPTADSTKNYFMSQQLSKLDTQTIVISDSSVPTTADLLANFTRVHYDQSSIGFGEKLALEQNCSLGGLD